MIAPGKSINDRAVYKKSGADTMYIHIYIYIYIMRIHIYIYIYI